MSQEFQYSSQEEAIIQMLAQIGSDAAPGLIDALCDEDVYVRRKAVRALGQVGDAIAVPALREALRDNDRDVRIGACYALGQIGDVAAVPNLVPFHDDFDIAG
jgi:HEAT repeat protein